jgi:putative SOS response-associated peptidase YedK
MYIACLYAEWVNPSNPMDRLQGVAAITDDPPPEIAAAGHDRVPVNLAWEAAIKWLEPQGRSDAELQALLDHRQRPYYEHRAAA